MTALAVIQELDSLRPNGFSQEQKLQWVDRLDQFIRRVVLLRYGEAPEIPMGEPDRELIMPEPFTEGYLYWLEAKLHYFNQEIDRYNAAIRMFRGSFEDYQRQLHQDREWKPQRFQM